MPSGGYEGLRSYKVAEAVYDATVVFCNRFIPLSSRTHDQMVQAARSGVRNISEGSGAAATSKKSEMKLTNVARASLGDELVRDYKSYLIQHGLRVWPKDSKLALMMRARLMEDLVPYLPPTKPGRVQLTGLAGLADFVSKADPELAANAMLCATHQAAYLLKRQVEAQAEDFKTNGGFTERLYAARVKARAEPPAPNCPQCNAPMTRRHAKATAKAFWGCSGYPHCRGIIDIV
jgi:restriction system protein